VCQEMAAEACPIANEEEYSTPKEELAQELSVSVAQPVKM